MDLNLFDFDYDLTFMVFFMDADERVYARYGGRDATSPDARQSLEGLKYTMHSVLGMHQQAQKTFAPRIADKKKFIREVSGGAGRGCMHCHDVKEALNRKRVGDGEWSRDEIWRFPLPENIGVRLELHRGNVVQEVAAASPAARAGLKPGDVLSQLGQVPIHSFGDVQFALDRAPMQGNLSVTWLRDRQPRSGSLSLPAGWKKTDLGWRPSVQALIPLFPLAGQDLTSEERKTFNLTATQLAFRQQERVHTRAREAGIQAGDIVIGLDDRKLDLKEAALKNYVQMEYLTGDTITLTLIRNGRTLKVPLMLRAR